MIKSLPYSIQDYLKSIYELTEDDQPPSTNPLEERLSGKPASMLGMTQSLASVRPPLFRYPIHQAVILTPAGKRTALEVIRNHRLIETWLVQILGCARDEVQNEAEKLDHVISGSLKNALI